MKKRLYIGTIIVIIIGIVLTAAIKLKYNYDIKGGTKVQINIGREFNEKDVEEVAGGVLGSGVQVEKVDILGETAGITSDNIPAEKLTELVAKLNERYETDTIKEENVLTIQIPNVRVRDLVSNYIFPLSLASIIFLAYAAIITKNRISNPLLLGISMILSGLLLLSMLAILRIAIDRGILMSGVITYILTVLFTLTVILKKDDWVNSNVFITIICIISSIGIIAAGIITSKIILVSSGIELIIGILVALYTSILIGMYKYKLK